MNTERLLREIDQRLSRFSADDRAEVADAVREEIARERRRLDPSGTVEKERERRQEAETLREILEAINRQASLEETIEEVLKQLSRIVVFDSCSVALRENQGGFRILAGRGFGDASVVGLVFRDEVSEMLGHSMSAVTLEDISQDLRFDRIEGMAEIRSWAGIPLLVEGEVIGLLCLDRHTVAPFDEEELHRAKAVAFSAAAAIRKAQLLDKVRRYATLMERVVRVDQAVFAGLGVNEVAEAILEGALHVGEYQGGLLVLGEGPSARIAASRDVALERGTPVPAGLSVKASTRLEGDALGAVAPGLGGGRWYLVPVATRDTHLGTLVLVDASGPSPDDLLMEAYASRSASALLHATTRKP